jgi:hypothetical protein
MHAQEISNNWYIGIFGGGINYQGDLQPTSFSFSRAGGISKIFIKRYIGSHFALKAGLGSGSFGASDQYNRDYLQPRNLSFQTSIKEVSLDAEASVFDISKVRFTPYALGSIAGFRYNPYVKDENGHRVYLQPLSTEGQGLSEYPDRKPYKLNQLAIGFGGGFRFSLSDNVLVSLEAIQHKTFTDYLDDVSTTYVDQDILLATKGERSVAFAFRGDELHNNISYPPDGEQRGTPKEKDWYYYMGLSIEVNMSSIKNIFIKKSANGKDYYNARCPTNF